VNLPNKLTVSRFVLTGLFMVSMFRQSPVNDTIALFLFAIASYTDYLDGKIARSRNLITNFGALMDPLADKILTCSAFIALIDRGPQMSALAGFKVEAWMVIVIVARELAITGLRLLAASKQLVLSAERYGKHKTISQITAILALLVLGAYPHWGSWAELVFKFWVPWFALTALWVTVLLTLSSGVIYLWRNRTLYLSDM
jgi:CDP-diacylglycerol---glycerol-3-phosphate 3-phosphatidyltransferase